MRRNAILWPWIYRGVKRNALILFTFMIKLTFLNGLVALENPKVDVSLLTHMKPQDEKVINLVLTKSCREYILDISLMKNTQFWQFWTIFSEMVDFHMGPLLIPVFIKILFLCKFRRNDSFCRIFTPKSDGFSRNDS